jgi:hypothetical protein
MKILAGCEMHQIFARLDISSSVNLEGRILECMVRKMARWIDIRILGDHDELFGPWVYQISSIGQR